MSVEVTVNDLAEFVIGEENAEPFLKISRGTIRDRREDGAIHLNEEGKYPVIDLVQKLIAFYRNRTGDKSDKNNLLKARVRTETARAKIYENQLSVRTGKLVFKRDVDQAWKNALINFRSRMDALEARMVSHLDTKGQQKLHDEKVDMLLSLSGVTYETEVETGEPDLGAAEQLEDVLQSEETTAETIEDSEDDEEAGSPGAPS